MHDIVLQVKEVDVQLEEVHVAFLTQHGSQFCWESKDDHFWEKLDYFRRNCRLVAVRLNEEQSTQHKHLFDII